LELDTDGRFVSESTTADDGEACLGDGVNFCCPVGFTCEEDGCVGSPTGVNECRDYGSQKDCESDIYGVGSAQNDIYGALVGRCEESEGGTADIGCIWSLEIDGRCEVQLECKQSSCVGVGCESDLELVDYSCQYDYPESECIDGFFSIEYEVTDYSDGAFELCEQEPVKVACGGFTFEVGFFENWQLIFSFVFVSLIYAFIVFRRGQFE
jgi:hypothetical protein